MTTLEKVYGFFVDRLKKVALTLEDIKKSAEFKKLKDNEQKELEKRLDAKIKELKKLNALPNLDLKRVKDDKLDAFIKKHHDLGPIFDKDKHRKDDFVKNLAKNHKEIIDKIKKHQAELQSKNNIFGTPKKEEVKRDIFGFPKKEEVKRDIFGFPKKEEVKRDIFGFPKKEEVKRDIFGFPKKEEVKRDIFGFPKKEEVKRDMFGFPKKDDKKKSEEDKKIKYDKKKKYFDL